MEDELAPEFDLQAKFTKRGRWTYRRVQVWSDLDVGAWQLDDSSWYLRQRKGANHCLRWCGYCYRPPYRWWQLHSTKPDTWLVADPPPWWRRNEPPVVHGRKFPDDWWRGYGVCTHQHRLDKAMKISEKHIYDVEAEMVLAALGGIGGKA
jgi:hypothetical protein